MIKSFACKDTRALFKGKRVPRFINIEKVAMRKLAMLDQASCLEDLRIPPNNQLEGLQGNRKGQCSIRINSQFRVCFVWTERNAEHVQIIDYH